MIFESRIGLPSGFSASQALLLLAMNWTAWAPPRIRSWVVVAGLWARAVADAPRMAV